MVQGAVRREKGGGKGEGEGRESGSRRERKGEKEGREKGERGERRGKGERGREGRKTTPCTLSPLSYRVAYPSVLLPKAAVYTLFRKTRGRIRIRFAFVCT